MLATPALSLHRAQVDIFLVREFQISRPILPQLHNAAFLTFIYATLFALPRTATAVWPWLLHMIILLPSEAGQPLLALTGSYSGDILLESDSLFQFILPTMP